MLQALGTITFRLLQKNSKKKFHACVPLTAHGTDNILDNLHNQNMGIGVSLKVPKCEIFDRMDSRNFLP